MAPTQASTIYRKQDGILAISEDRKSISWTPTSPRDASPSLTIPADTITNLQQTPETNPKVMLKIFVQGIGQTDPTTHTFSFTSPSNARTEANNIKEALTSAIQAAKASQNGVPGRAGGTSAAMTIANAISGSRHSNVWEDDEKLKYDVTLQESLMRENPALQKTFMEARRTKPDSITNTQFTSQFWSSRIQLLRAYAIAKGQNRATYSVFASLKREEGGTKMNLTAEHVHLIFEQYPLMKRVYDEIVPSKYNELEFWSKFFQSRLFSKLRGLKIDDSKDPKDRVLDKYLYSEELTGLRPSVLETYVPRIIDMEGNEQNHSQRMGNKPELDLRPTNVPVIRILNSLSEKLMEHVRPSANDPSLPLGRSYETYDQIRLRDLQDTPEQDRHVLKIKDQSRFFSEDWEAAKEESRGRLTGVDPRAAAKIVRSDFVKSFPRPGIGPINLGPDKSESGDEYTKSYSTIASITTAHIIELIRQHRAQTEGIPASSGLSESVYERLSLVQATTTEFLNQFWSAFLSGDQHRVAEITSLIESLDRAMDRIKAVADEAEEDRNSIIRRAQKSADDIFQRTGKKQKVDYKRIGGGAKVVNQLLGPTMKALANATAQYQKALREQAGEEG